MGCDIHFYVEKRVRGDVWRFVGGTEYEDRLYTCRNYDLFAILANVRNGRGFAGINTGDGFVPIDMPRGVPSDASTGYICEVNSWDGDGHSHSYFTVAELIAYDWTQETTHRGCVSAREFAHFHLSGKPNSWSGSVSGVGVEHVSNNEMLAFIQAGKDKFTWHDYHAMSKSGLIESSARKFTSIKWTEPYYESCSLFLSNTMPRLWSFGKPDDVRIVFFFDN